MTIRCATEDDAEAITSIYAPIVRETTISFELEVPTVDEMRSRIASSLTTLPWLVSTDVDGRVAGDGYAGKHRDARGARPTSGPSTSRPMCGMTCVARVWASCCTAGSSLSWRISVLPGLRRHRLAERGEHWPARTHGLRTDRDLSQPHVAQDFRSTLSAK